MTPQQETLFDKDFQEFIKDGFAYIAQDRKGRWTLAEGFARMHLYTKLFIEKNSAGNSSRSAFQIVLDALLGEADPYVRLRQAAIEAETPELSQEEFLKAYRAMPSRTAQYKFQSDPVFRAGVERLIAGNLI